MATTQPVHPLSTGGDTSWVTLKGNGTFDIVQPVETWMDTSGAASFKILYQVLGISNCTMSLETAMKPEGSMGWNTLLTTASTGHTYIIAEANNGASYPLQQLLRWRVDGSEATNWQACFRSTVVLK